MLVSLQQLTLDEYLALGRAVFLVFSFVLATVTFAAWRRAAIRQTELSSAHDAEMVKRLDGLDARLIATRNSINHITETLERVSRKETTGNRAIAGYPIAIRLARAGAGVDELVATCGLSPNEAELVCRIHGAAKTAA
jgi:uncharacterized protein YlxW (UPF0749 family)